MEHMLIRVGKVNCGPDLPVQPTHPIPKPSISSHLVPSIPSQMQVPSHPDSIRPGPSPPTPWHTSYHIASHRVAPHHTISHCTASHRIASHCTASHRIAPNHIAPHRIAHYIASHHTAPHRTALHCTTSHRTAPHLIASHRIASRTHHTLVPLTCFLGRLLAGVQHQRGGWRVAHRRDAVRDQKVVCVKHQRDKRCLFGCRQHSESGPALAGRERVIILAFVCAAHGCDECGRAGWSYVCYHLTSPIAPIII